MVHGLWSMVYGLWSIVHRPLPPLRSESLFLRMHKFLDQLFQHQQYDPDTFFLMAGPCVVESEPLVMEVAEKVSKICQRLRIPLIFKSSYRKANRTSANSFTGLGDLQGLEIIRNAGKKFSLPTVTDIHSEKDATMAAPFVDVLQIPAFLCRQT